ncbi:EF-hand domain pair [Phytophthora infestans]|uniref:EF-hand domain pair n=1 Tax=Phytophthora infestans TaxID=4787 RepID=A0A833RS06_PHYIN|nr:EF-hand domain pair [Phytophthora infestans]
MDIMMRLKGAGFSAIANAFREREKRLGGGLPLPDFVEIVLPGLPRVKTAEEKTATVSALVDLFEDIDINGDGVMEFDEFTSFCVDAGMVASRTQGATLKHRYERDTKHALKTSAITAPVSNAASHTSTNATFSPNPVSNWIEKLKWSASFRMFLVVENAARSVKIFTSEGKFVTEVYVTNERQTQTNANVTVTSTPVVTSPMNDVLLVGDGVAFVTPTSVAPPSASSVSILDAVFIHRFMWLGVSTTDFAISFYDMNDARKPTSTSNTSPGTIYELLKNAGITTNTAQRMLRFCESSALLLGSGNDFIVNIWKVVDAETKFLWRRLSVHADLVMDALEIPVHDLLVTCDLRHTIQLWDITDGRNRGALMAHGRGVRQLCYSEHHDLLLSAGFEFEALAWDLGSRQVALKLSGHRAPLVGVQLALFQTERAITADSDGVFKVWDITRGHASSTNASISQAVQLESIDLGVPSVHVEPISFATLHPYSRDMWVATSGSCTLQRLRSVRVQQFDEVPLRAFYHSSANKFVVVAGSVCSLWDGKTGSCTEEFAHVGNVATTGGSKKDSATTPPSDSASRPSDHSAHNEAGTELLTCTLDAKCRKLIVMSEQGALSVFNCQNFVLMRQCQESFLSKIRVPRRKTIAGKNPAMNSASSCAVVGLHYCSENKLIIVTDAGTSAITVIDDNSNQDSSKGIGILRRLINIPGGISSSAYSFHPSIIATVGADSEGMRISLWDFETFAHLGNCRYDDDENFAKSTKDGYTLTIQTLEFWDEFPVVMAGDSIGGVYFFAVTPLLHAYTGKLLHAFINDHDSNVRQIQNKSRNMQESIPEDENDGEKVQKADVTKEAAEAAARKLLLHSKKRKNALITKPVVIPEPEKKSPLESASAVTCIKVVFDEDANRHLLFVGDEQGSIAIWDPTVMIQRLSLAKIPEIKCKYLRRGYQPKAMFFRDFLKDTSGVDGSLPSREKHRQAVSHGSSKDWRGAMLLGEDMEHMNVRASHTDLKKLSRRRQETRGPRTALKLPVPQQTKNLPRAHAKETAVVNAVAAAEFLLRKGSTATLSTRRTSRALNMPQNASESTKAWPGSSCYETFPRDVTLVRRWQAHTDALTSLEISRHPNIVVTCGMDMRGFVWDWEGACLGKLFDPENQGQWPWRFRKDNATRTKERDFLVQELLQQLERSPAEKMELRRQSLYAQHVGRRNVNELRNVNTMLLEHIISKNPEIKLLEQEIHDKKTQVDSAANGKTTKMQLKPEIFRTLKKTNAIITPRQTLRLQSLNQLGSVPHEELSRRKASVLQSEQPAFMESGDLKMDKTYLENELSIACPTASSPLLRPNRDGDVKQQIQKEYQLAQQAIATRATLTRKAREMYSNMEGVRTRHSIRRPDTSSQDVESLEVSDFLKQHFAPSVLAIRPQTAPARGLKLSKSEGHVGLRHQIEDAPLQLQISASESTFQSIESSLSNDSVARKLSNISFAGRRRSSLDEFYKEEYHRYRQDRELNLSVPEEVAVDGEKQLRPLQKLHGINEIIDKAHGYCIDAQSTRPGTAPVGTRRNSVLLTESSSEHLKELNDANAVVLRQHLETTKHRMQEALRDGKRPHRQNLRKMRQQALEQQQKRRMHSYLQQKRRELTTNIGNVFKGLQTSQGPEHEHEEAELSPKQDHKTKDKNAKPHMLSAKKSFGIYSVSEVMSVIRLFWSMDADGSGNISMAELQQFKSVFEKLGFPNIGAVFQTIDANGDGQVSLRELLATCFHFASKEQIDSMLQLAKVGSVRSFLLGVDETDQDGESSSSPFANAADKLEPRQRNELMAIFRVFDHNGDGGVSMQEIMEALRVDDDDVMAAVMTKERGKPGNRVSEPVVSSGLTREDVELIYSEFDRDKDATLDFNEFVAVMANLYPNRPILLR